MDDLDDMKRFIIAQEDNGNFLRVYIPGNRPNNWPARQITWTGKDPIPSFNDMRHEARRLFKSLKKRGLTQNLPERIIPGYSHSYAYDFHSSAIREITTDPRDQVYMRNDVAYNMKHMLWFPLLRLLQEKIKIFDYIQVELPVFPPVLTEDLCQTWFENNQRASKFFERLIQNAQDTRIEKTASDNQITLTITNHPFVGKPVHRIQLLPSEKATVDPLSDEQLKTLHLKVLSRDSNMLKGLTDSERRQLRKGAPADFVDSYPIHWVRWLSLAGEMNEQNAILVSADVKKSYQFSVRYPFEQYWRRNHTFFEKLGLPVFVEIPIPMGEYRSKPVPRVITPRQNRRHLEKMTRQAVQEYFLDKEYN